MSRATTAFLVGVAGVLLIRSPFAHAADGARDSSELTTSRQAAPTESGLFPDAPGHHTLAFDLGLGSAVGLAGATYTLAFGPAELEVGVGFGISAWQTSGMLKLALYGTPTFRLVTGAGLAYTSGAPFSTSPIGDRGLGDGVGNPIWLNLDVAGFEYRSPSHFYAAASAGLTRGIGNGTDNIKVSQPNCPDECYENIISAGWYPQIRGAIGAWF